MDINKLEILKKIGYKVVGCCGLCEYGMFNIGPVFGVCRKYKYDHLKHNDKNRDLSICKYGICNNPGKMVYMGEINNFLTYL